VWNTTTQSPAPVCVGAVVDAMDPDCLGLVVNPMEHPVGATACAVLACELAATVTYLRRPGEKPQGVVKG
jgi:hypothetical protein